MQLPAIMLASVNLLYSVLYCSTNCRRCAGAVPASPWRRIAMMAWPNFNGYLSTRPKDLPSFGCFHWGFRISPQGQSVVPKVSSEDRESLRRLPDYECITTLVLSR